MTPVHYEPQRDAEPSLRDLPWIAPEPVAAGAVGHLFYYPSTPWQRRLLRGLRIWTGGHGPDRGRNTANTKILWMSYGPPLSRRMTINGQRLRRSARFTQHLDFGPSIVDFPRPGCWRLTLETGRVRLHVTLRAVQPR
jgi:hypothetical protein